MNRIFSVGSWLGVVLFGVGCGDVVYEHSPGGEVGEVDQGSATGAGGASATGATSATSATTVGSGGGRDREASAQDSGTLEVALTVTAYAASGTPASEVQVALAVEVFEWETDEPVTDAIVMAGPLGQPFALDYSVHSWATYGGGTTGYERAWELSVVRGDDHLTGVVLVGPSFHTVEVSPDGDGATIAWSPFAEPGVRTVACLDSISPADPPEQCAQLHDEGSAVFAPAAWGDAILVDRRTKVPLGIGGSAIIEVAVTSEVPYVVVGW